MSVLAEAFARVPPLLAAHVRLSAAALALGIAIGLPLAVAAARRPGVGRVALGFASLTQTIPSLALLALFFPLLTWLSAAVGGGIPALGFLPSLLALTLYALLPILRNGVAALAGIDSGVREAADAVGMTPWQKLRLVEAPLALPVAVAGIRTAAVWTIGAATLSTTVGSPSLGDLIFAGLQTQAWAAGPRRLRRGGGAGAGGRCADRAGRARPRDAAALAGGGGAGGARARHGRRRRAPLAGGRGRADGGGRRQELLRAVHPRAADRRAADSLPVIGSPIATGSDRRWRSAPSRAGRSTSMSIMPARSGPDRWGAATCRRRRRCCARSARGRGRPHGVRMAGALGFENAYAFAMRSDDAKARGIATLADLAAVSPGLALGSDLEFLERPEWAAVKAAYPAALQKRDALRPGPSCIARSATGRSTSSRPSRPTGESPPTG